MLACIGASWFAYQIFLVPQPRTFTPNWHDAQWIEASDTSSDPSPVAYFRRSLQFSVIPDRAYITITADQAFLLYVNGIYIGSNTQDFVSGETPQTYIFDIDSTLVKGTNIVGIRSANVDQSAGWGPVEAGAVPTPSLLANISVSWGHQNYNYGTDTTWQATRQAALAHPRMSKTKYDWAKPQFDATSWRGAQVSSQPLTYPPLMINPHIYEQPLPISWISAGAGQESYYVRNFSIPAGYENALLRIVATGKADIFINDHLYTRWNGLANVPQVNVVTYLSSNGQPAPYRNGLMLGIYDITPYLHSGSNTIAVHVLAPGTTTAKIGLDTQRSAMSLEILAGSAENYQNVVSAPAQWHASLKPVAGWTKEDGPAFMWSSPVLIGRPGSTHTFYLPDSNTPHNVQALAPGPLSEIIGLSIIAVLAFWLLLSLVIRHRFMLSLWGWAGARRGLICTKKSWPPTMKTSSQKNLGAQRAAGTGDDDRKGREGASPSSTQRRGDAPHATSGCRCVDDGFTPSRPLRSPGSHTNNRAIKFTSMRHSPYAIASLVFLPALALEATLVTLSRESLITQPFPYTALWGLALIAVVLLTALLLYFHTHKIWKSSVIVGTGPAPVRKRIEDTSQPIWSAYANPSRTAAGPVPTVQPNRLLHTLGIWLKRHWGILPIFLLTIPMVIYKPAYEPYWQDELSSYYAARYIMTHGIPAFPSGFIYPKGELFSYLLAFVMTIFGTNSPIVTRSISMVLFLASLPIFYSVGCKLFNRRVAWFATTMLAFSPYAMIWSRQTRMYEQAQFMVIIILGVLYWAIQNRHKTRPIRIAVLCILIAYFSHEEVFIILPALIICSLVASREGPYGFPAILKQKHWWIPALIAVAIISTQLSLVILTHPPALGTDQSRRPQIQLTTDNVPYYFRLLFEPQTLKDGPKVWTLTQPLLTVNSLLAVLGCVIAFRRKNRRACYCALFLVISTATLVFLFTMQADRYLYPLLPVYYLMAAYGTWTVLHALWIFARQHLALARIRPNANQIAISGPQAYTAHPFVRAAACPCPVGAVIGYQGRDKPLPLRLTSLFAGCYHNPPADLTRLLLRIALGGTVALLLASILLVPMLPISNFNLFVSRVLGVQYHRHFADYDNVGQYMHNHMRPGDTVITIAPAVITLYEAGKVDDYFSIDRALFLFEHNGQLMETTSGAHPLLNEAEFQHVLAEHTRIWLITDNGGYQGGVTRNGRFTFPPPDFHLVYEGYGSGIYFRSSTP